MPPNTASYLDPAILTAIGSLEMRARMIIEGLTAGMHRSPYQGYSVEFAQHRQYAPGDDLRHLDWKVYGRSDKLYLKQYQKETNLDLVLLVDASGSMAYGSQGSGSPGNWRKFDYAATLAASLAHLALNQNDRVGLVLFADSVQATTRTSNAQGHWKSIINALNSQSSALPTDFSTGDSVQGRGTDLGRLFEQVLAKLTQRSLIVLISDLFDTPEAIERSLARVRYSRHDLIVLQTLDSDELTFPFRGPARFMGLEGEGQIGLDPSALRDGYLKALRDHLQQVEQAARRFGFDHNLLDTSNPLGAPLSKFLAYRAASMSKGR